MKNKDRHHYDRRGKYIGKTSEKGPYDWIGGVTAACVILYILSQSGG